MLIDTPWETRNLGMPTFAIDRTFWKAPDFEALRDRLTTIERGFVSARVPATDVRSVDRLCRLGFSVIEQVVELSASTSHDAVLEAFAKDFASFVPPRLDAADIAIEFASASPSRHSGEIMRLAAGAFTTDRFHRDFRCPTEVADRRTQLWLEQLVTEPGIEELVVTHRGEAAAFTYRRGPRILVGAVGPSFSLRGLARLTIVATRDRARATGERSSTSVAPSSVDSLNAHFRSGFEARRQAFTLHWWWSETPFA